MCAMRWASPSWVSRRLISSSARLRSVISRPTPNMRTALPAASSAPAACGRDPSERPVRSDDSELNGAVRGFGDRALERRFHETAILGVNSVHEHLQRQIVRRRRPHEHPFELGAPRVNVVGRLGPAPWRTCKRSESRSRIEHSRAGHCASITRTSKSSVR
jgi:hypothetical protein